MPKFHRSKKDKLLAGVLGGFAEYYNIDPTVVRIVWLISLGLTGFIPGILVYIIAALIFPIKGRKKSSLLQKLMKLS